MVEKTILSKYNSVIIFLDNIIFGLLIKYDNKTLTDGEKKLFDSATKLKKDILSFETFIDSIKQIQENLSHISDRLNDMEDYITSRRLISIKKNEKRNSLSKGMKRAIFQRDSFTCKKCGNNRTKDKNIELHVDHIIPLSKGGTNEVSNLQTLCKKCNLIKLDGVEINDA